MSGRFPDSRGFALTESPSILALGTPSPFRFGVLEPLLPLSLLCSEDGRGILGDDCCFEVGGPDPEEAPTPRILRQSIG